MTVSNFNGEAGGGATEDELVDKFTSSSLTSAILSSVCRFSLLNASKWIRFSTGAVESG